MWHGNTRQGACPFSDTERISTGLVESLFPGTLMG